MKEKKLSRLTGLYFKFLRFVPGIKNKTTIAANIPIIPAVLLSMDFKSP